MFELSQKPLEAIDFKSQFSNPQAGAYVTFEGWVRNHNEGKDVLSLDYQSYESMAQKEAQKIIEEAKSKFEIYDVHCMHRVGQLQIGDMAVFVGVISAHRQAAFLACQYTIDQIKARVPIWKKEYYTDGDSGWVHCEHCSKVKISE